MTIKKIAFVIVSLIMAAGMSFAATVTYSYDQWGRVTKAEYDNGKSITYTYDNAGNLLTRQVDPALTGDVYPDNIVNLKDAIVALQIAAGDKPQSIASNADINQNQIICVEEAVFALQKSAGLK